MGTDGRQGTRRAFVVAIDACGAGALPGAPASPAASYLTELQATNRPAGRPIAPEPAAALGTDA